MFSAIGKVVDRVVCLGSLVAGVMDLFTCPIEAMASPQIENAIAVKERVNSALIENM